MTVFLAAAGLLIGNFSFVITGLVDLAILALLLREPWPVME